MDVKDAITARHSVRAFTDRPVAREQIEDLLACASRAPSGTNIQPWNVFVVTGDRLAMLKSRLQEAFYASLVGEYEPQEAYPYYPSDWFEPYKGRRKTLGLALYGLLGIPKEDQKGMVAQTARNFALFDAPVGVFVFCDAKMGQGALLDCGMFVQSLLLCATGQGLGSCPQAALNPFHRVIREVLDIPDHLMMVCTVSLGFEDKSHVVNSLSTDRESPQAFAHFYD
ncbi:MAG: hypothetical protein RL133_676 [Pseudomonadota bacterium]|jgi:nitroreductase